MKRLVGLVDITPTCTDVFEMLFLMAPSAMAPAAELFLVTQIIIVLLELG